MDPVTPFPAPEPGTCECGCQTPTPGRFRPGHDAKLKSLLKGLTTDRRWWVRERAVASMVELGWGRFVDRIVLATTPVRSRYRGRFCETRHIDSLHGCVLDEAGVSHSVWFCPAAQGRGRWVKGGPTGWACEACIHLTDWSERVADPAYGTKADAPAFLERPAPKPAPKRQRPTVRPDDIDPAWRELWLEAQAEADAWGVAA